MRSCPKLALAGWQHIKLTGDYFRASGYLSIELLNCNLLRRRAVELHCCEFVAEKTSERHFCSAIVFGSSVGIEQHIAFDADLLDQIELALQEIDMFLFAPQYFQQQVAGDVRGWHEIRAAFRCRGMHELNDRALRRSVVPGDGRTPAASCALAAAARTVSENTESAAAAEIRLRRLTGCGD